MRCLIDTNILISTALFPNSVPAQAYMKCVTLPHTAVVCDYPIEEIRRVYKRKFSNRMYEFERFISRMALSVEIVRTPPEETKGEKKIRDLNDRLI